MSDSVPIAPFDPAKLLQELDEAANKAHDFHSLSSAVKKYATPGVESPAMSLVWAFEYHYVEITNVPRRRQWGPYAPWRESKDGVFPMPLPKVDDKWLKFWAEVAEQSKSPLIRARLNDLLWERKWDRRPDLHARAAIDAYADLVASTLNSLYLAEGLSRAIELICQINDDGRQTRVVECCITQARLSLESKDGPKPGVTFRFVEALLQLPREKQPPEIDGLLDSCQRAYGHSPWHAQTILELRETRTKDPATINQLHVAQAKQWLQEARSSKGLKRLCDLQKALELAHKYGIKSIADTASREIQEIPEEELELKTISATTEIPRKDVEAFVASFVETPDWKDSLKRFGAYGPPSGDHSQNLQAVKNHRSQSPFQFLVKQTILGDDNAPIRTPTSEEEIATVALARQESLGISLFGHFATDILDAVRVKQGTINHAGLTDFFDTGLIPGDTAERIARALVLYWEGHPDESAHLLVPKIETVFRNLARELGIIIIYEPIGDRPGGIRSLGELLRSLKGRLNESWRRYFVNLLCDPVGVNLRNRLAHGLMPLAKREDAALLIHVVCHLRLMSITEGEKKS